MESTIQVKNLVKRSILWIEKLFNIKSPIKIYSDEAIIALYYQPHKSDQQKMETTYHYEENGAYIAVSKQGDSITLVEIIGLSQIP